MRRIVSVLAGLAALAAVSAQAVRVPPTNTPAAELRAVPPFELVAQGCGPGWHRHHWRDYWGAGTGADGSELVNRQSRQSAMSLVSPLADKPKRRLNLRQADQAREDFAAIGRESIGHVR